MSSADTPKQVYTFFDCTICTGLGSVVKGVERTALGIYCIENRICLNCARAFCINCNTMASEHVGPELKCLFDAASFRSYRELWGLDGSQPEER